MLKSECTPISTYPFLFHKQILGIIPNQNSEAYFEHVINTSFSDKTPKKNANAKLNIDSDAITAHLHCYDISKFEEFYGEYINQIVKYCSVIVVTYVVNSNPGYIVNTSTNIRVLHILNRGMDIGAKILATQYLNQNNISYKYMLFLHSKTNVEKRKIYFQSLVYELKRLYNIVKDDNSNVLGYFPPEILNGNNSTYVINKEHIKPSSINEIKHSSSIITLWREMCNYMKLDTSITIFPEGNSYILKKSVVDTLFQSQFYLLLNTERSFDMHWVYVYYKLNHIQPTPQNVYKIYKAKKMCGNNIMRKNARPHKTISINHPDSQLEHVFERLVFNIIQKQRGEIRIIPLPTILLNSYNSNVENLNRAINCFIFKTTPPWYHIINEIGNKGDISSFIKSNANILQIPTFWINLDSNKERQYHMNLQLNSFKKQSIEREINRISAVDGSTICMPEFALKSNFHSELYLFSQRQSRQSIFNNNPMTNNEMGCLLSHFIAMHTFLLNYPNEPYVLILEDDANLISWESMRRLKQLEAFLNTPNNPYECVQLSNSSSDTYKLPQSTTTSSKEQAVFVDWTAQLNNTNGQHPFWTTGAYTLSRSACQKIINIVKNNQIDYCVYPADWFIYMHLHTATMYPPLCCQHSHLKSDIRNNTVLQQKSNSVIASAHFKKKTVFLSTMYSIIDVKDRQCINQIKMWINNVSQTISSNADIFIFGDQLPYELEECLPQNIIYFYLDYNQFIIHCNRTHSNLEPNIRRMSHCDLIFTRETVESTHKWLAYLFSEYIVSRKYEYYGTITAGDELQLVSQKLNKLSIFHMRHNLKKK